MKNIFMDNESHGKFSWEKLGDIQKGRETLGEEMPVLVYRMLQYSVNQILIDTYGQNMSDNVFRAAGHLAGEELAKNQLDLSLDFDAFIAQLQATLRTLKIGILRMEEFDKNNKSFQLTIGEDLDCSGLPVTEEVVCTYDEGFIAGILKAYTGEEYRVREIDCWANGDRVCRFQGTVE